MTEEWRTIPGFEGIYEASNLGRVRSIDRVVEQRNRSGVYRRRLPGAMLKPSSGSSKPSVHLFEPVFHERRTLSVSRLVASAFMGPCPDGVDVIHINYDVMDNRVDNLRYDRARTYG